MQSNDEAAEPYKKTIRQWREGSQPSAAAFSRWLFIGLSAASPPSKFKSTRLVATLGAITRIGDYTVLSLHVQHTDGCCDYDVFLSVAR